jgi:aldehyde:ferredoxin oxidoreductase
VIGQEAFERSLDEYYELRGWDADGVPRQDTVSALAVDVQS